MSKLIFDYNNMMKLQIGKYGITKDELEKTIPHAKQALKKFQSNRGVGMQGWSELCRNQGDVVESIQQTSKYIRKNFEYFVVLGIGGSALGPYAVFQALCHLHYNDLSDSKRKGPKFYVEDNIDPERMNALLDVIDIEKTVFNVISKSGGTSETMAQYLIITDLIKNRLTKKDTLANHIIVTTSSTTGNLIKIAKEENFKTFYIPDGVGGRFSELSPVGLLSAGVLGVDIEELLEGAKIMDEKGSEPNFQNNAPLVSATLMYLAIKKNMNISVMMPYADSLRYISDWYAQLWGESLGKRSDIGGSEVFCGQTPVKALGVTDQHSQVQLYTEGPFDKVITFIGIDRFRSDVVIPDGLEGVDDVNFLCGHTLSEMINCERLATEFAITKAGKLNNTITIDELNANTLGQLLTFFMLQTAFCGYMLNIDPFDQPGVEMGKKATFAMMGRAGFEMMKRDIVSTNAKDGNFIVD